MEEEVSLIEYESDGEETIVLMDSFYDGDGIEETVSWTKVGD